MGKRSDYITWDEYFMGVAKLSGQRSKDPNTQVGSCIVSANNKILSMGYNGLPIGCSDDEFPWAREGDELDTKYLFVTHSELNAILNYRGGSLDGSKLYVTLFPCNECAKAIIQAGIRTVVYETDKYADSASVLASKRMFDAAGVRYYQYQKTGRKIELELYNKRYGERHGNRHPASCGGDSAAEGKGGKDNSRESEDQRQGRHMYAVPRGAGLS